MEQNNLDKNAWYFPDEKYQALENSVLGQIEFCLNGLYSSTNLLEALEYAPGPILYRLRLHGTVVGSDRHKYRTYLFGGDVTDVLICFARKQALIHRDLLDQLFSNVGHKSIMAWLVDGKSEFREVAQHIAHGRGDILAKRHYNAASAAVYAVYWSTKEPLTAAIFSARNASRATAWRTVNREGGFGADVDRLHKLESVAMDQANEMLEQMVIHELKTKKENQPIGNTNNMTRKEKLDAISNFMYHEWIDTIDNLLAQRNWTPRSFSTLDNITHEIFLTERAAYITAESTGRPEELGKDFVSTISEEEWSEIYANAYDCLAGTVYDYDRWISCKVVLDSSYLSRYFSLANIDDCYNLVSILEDSDQSDIVEKAEQVIWESAKNRYLKHVYPDALVGSLGLSDAEAEKSILNAVYKVLEDEEDDEPYIL